MELRLKLILGCSLALLLDLAVSVSIPLPNLAPATIIQIDVDTVYAYFGVQDFDKSISGLWINTSDPLELYTHRVSYFIVLNITNRSDKLASIDKFEVAAAPKIVVQNGTEMENKVVYDMRTIEWYPDWSQYWSLVNQG
jgi:hypothetical protein